LLLSFHLGAGKQSSLERNFEMRPLVKYSASSYKWPKFTLISFQKCSCSTATLRFLRLISVNFSSFSLSNQNPEQALRKQTIMAKTQLFLFLVLFLVLTVSFISLPNAQNHQQGKPKIAFTFDDGSISDFGEYKLERWNQLLLDNLKKHHLKAILFSMGVNKSAPKGKYVLSSWNDSGHLGTSKK
jgi:hypothetical protein